MTFKKGDIIKHKASGSRALVVDTSNSCYILSYDIDGAMNIGCSDAEFIFKLDETN